MKLRIPKDWIKKFKGQKDDFIPPMGALYEDKEKIKMIEIEADNKSPKKRLSYEEIFHQKIGQLKYLNITELENYRQEMIGWLDSIAVMTKEPGIKESRKQYLIGLRNHVIIKLIGEIKKAKKKINVQVCNGSKSDILRRFMKRASEILPHDTFQEIYGYAIMEQSELDDKESDL